MEMNCNHINLSLDTSKTFFSNENQLFTFLVLLIRIVLQENLILESKLQIISVQRQAFR